MGTSCKVHVVSEIFHPDTTSTGYFMTEIALSLAEQFRVEVYCSSSKASSAQRAAPLQRLEIHRIGHMPGTGGRLFWRVMSSIVRVMRIGSILLGGVREGDVLLVVTNPPFAPAVAAVVSLLTRATLVVLVHDVYPDAAIVAGIMQDHWIGADLLRVIQRWTVRKAARVVCIGRDMKELLLEQFPFLASRLRFIPNWAECPPRAYRCALKTSSTFGQSIGAQTSFTVLHAGNLGLTHDADLIAASIEMLRGVEGLVVAFAHARPLPASLQRLLACSEFPIRAGPMRASRDAQWDTLAAADVVLIAFKSGMRGVSVPSRMYNAFAAGKPIIAVADAHSEIARLIYEEQLGWVVPPGRADILAGVIMEARDTIQRCSGIGKRALALVEARFAKQRSLKSYLEVVSELVQERETVMTET